MLQAISPILPTSDGLAGVLKQNLQEKKRDNHFRSIRCTSIPAFPGQPIEQPQSTSKLDPSSGPALTNLAPNVGNGKWHRENESALTRSEPLPLPMAYPDSTPVPKEVEDMKNCDPEVKDCRDVIYQWTGLCSRCQGTGEVSYYKKKGREVICKCITCLGLGYVHKMTLRTDIDIVEELDDAS